MTHHLRLALVPVYLLLCLTLGGASAAGFWVNMILQLLAIPILLWAALAHRSAPMPAPARQLSMILLLLLFVVILQLIPLPPEIWTTLGGREAVANGFRLLNHPQPWLPISLAPHQTISSVLWLLPAIAVLFGIIKLGVFKANWIAWTIALVTVVSVGIGALQITGGAMSPWYFYEITNYGATTGFFSNANHMATLLVIAIPFLTALYLSARSKQQSAQTSSGMFVVLAGTLVVVIVGLIINRSLAGVGLLVPVAAASFLMLQSRKRKLPGWSVLVVLGLAIASIGAAFSTPFENNLTSGEAEASPISRYTSFSRSLQAAEQFLPAGSGIGTFRELYPSYEDANSVTRWYVNHVHSDYIELVLETGIPGALVLLIFLVWWSRRTAAVWRAEQPDYFARAATIASAAILAHSFVDYPLRTAAIGAVFAACCALMAEPRARVRASGKSSEPLTRARHLSAD